MSYPFKTSYPTRAEALKAARAMIALLKRPKGWKPRLHCSEPLPQHRKHGIWYASLVNGPMTLYCVSGESVMFYTLLGRRMEDAGLGNPAWSGNMSHRDPNAAIDAQVKAAQRVFAEMRAVEAHITPFLSTL